MVAYNRVTNLRFAAARTAVLDNVIQEIDVATGGCCSSGTRRQLGLRESSTAARTTARSSGTTST